MTTLLLGRPVRAEELPEIRWKFEPGAKHSYATERTFEWLIEATNPLRVSQFYALDVDLHVDEVSDDGSARLRFVVKRTHWRALAGPGARFDWDSAGKRVGELPEKIASIFDATAEAQVEVRVEPSGKVTEITLPEKLEKALEGQPPTLQNLGGLLSRSGFERLVRELFVAFPPPEEATEGRWARREELRVSAKSKASREISYRYAGRLKSLRSQYETFDLSSRWLLTEKERKEKIAIEDERSHGKLRFDITDGSLHSFELDSSFSLSSPRRAIVDGVAQPFEVKSEWRRQVRWKRR